MLHCQIPRFYIRLVEVLIYNVKCFVGSGPRGVDRGTRKDNDPVCRYRLWSRWWKPGCHASDLSVSEPGDCKTVSLFRRIVLTYREIPGVLIVAERLIADAEDPPNHSSLGHSV